MVQSAHLTIAIVRYLSYVKLIPFLRPYFLDSFCYQYRKKDIGFKITLGSIQ